MSVATRRKPKAARPIPKTPEKSQKRNPVRDFLEMIKFEHTLFALPFAYTGAFLAGQGHLPLAKFCLITLAMVSARTAGMSLNRVIDKDIDAANPRTANRAIPANIISPDTVWEISLGSVLVLLISAALLNPLCLMLSPLAVGVLFSYSYLKRYTWLCHLGLGLVLACAPIGGYIAVSGHLNAIPLSLGAAMIFWLAGFDVLYGCLDLDFDKQYGIHSIPQRFGVPKALWISGFFHLIAFAFFALTGILANLAWPYDLGLMLAAVVLIYEHAIVTPHDLRRINLAFFQANAAISIILFVATLTSFWVGP